MSSPFTRSFCVLALLGAAQVASAQIVQSTGAGAAGQAPYGSGAAMPNPNNAGAAGQGTTASGNVYSNPNAPRPLPPLDQATVNYDAAVSATSP